MSSSERSLWPRYIGEVETSDPKDKDTNLLICPRIEDRNPGVPTIPGDFRCQDCGRKVSVARSSWKLIKEEIRKTVFLCRPCWDTEQERRE